MNKQFTLTAESNEGFAFTFYIEKAIVGENPNEDYIIEGVASTTNVDHDKERMSLKSLNTMATIINEKSVPLRLEHQKDDNAIVGQVYSANVDDRNQLWIKARLDKNHPASSLLYKSLKEGVKLGLSVGGRVKKAVRELSEATGNMVKTFYDVILDEVSVTQRPANYDSWLVRKSIANADENLEVYRKSEIYQEFLFENPQLDYLRTFSKAIPDSSWVKSININNNDMKKAVDETKDEMKTKAVEETETKEKAVAETEETKEKAFPEKDETKEDTKKATKDEKDEETTKGFVTTKSFSEFQTMVAKGFNTLTSFLSKMDTAAMDQVAPDKKKEEAVGDKELGKGQGENALDTTNPDKKKDENVGDKEVGKAAGREGQENTEGDGDVGKAQDDETKDETKKAEDKKDDDMTKAIRNIETMLKGMTVTKSTESPASIDVFVNAITGAMENVTKSMKDKGMSLVGFEKSMVEAIKSDSELQALMKAMIREPGFKKSVVMGNAFYRTKDGQAFKLMSEPLETVKKSATEAPKSFKDAWKSEFGSAQDSK